MFGKLLDTASLLYPVLNLEKLKSLKMNYKKLSSQLRLKIIGRLQPQFFTRSQVLPSISTTFDT